ncbi:MAG TPA: alpha/beta hydrolase family protein [Terriglobales bacterium]|jgi:S-formylglutathione hydrolase FrmB|nr:alpha/beta hydrolase family protein [Terriglobales bacterium]
MRFLRILLLLSLFSATAFAQSRIDCNALDSHILKETIRYCVMLPAGYDAPTAKSYPVLYFLHGLGENEQALFKMGGWDLVEDLRRQHKITDFLIVTPDGEASFYVNSVKGKVRYSDFFLYEFMPFIEGKYRIRRERTSRAVSGISMGGYGAFRFAFAYPEQFSAVSAESAALIAASPDDLNAMLRSDTPMNQILGSVFGNPIDIGHWQQNDVFALARKNRTAIRRVAINFNCGRDDQFKFEVSGEALHRELDSLGIKNQFHIYPGDHSAPYFLAHLAELMEFHSQHFPTTK